MRQIQLALLSAIFLVLCVIAFQLTRLAADLQLGADIRGGLVAAAQRPPETREQRRARLQLEQQQLNQDFIDILETPAAPTPKHQKPTR